jgi:hypothetical protein
MFKILAKNHHIKGEHLRERAGHISNLLAQIGSRHPHANAESRGLTAPRSELELRSDLDHLVGRDVVERHGAERVA